MDDDPARRASRYQLDRFRAEDGVEAPPEPDAATRIERRAEWVEEVVRQAIARGEFDALPLTGKPIPNLTRHDPDWWLKGLVEREQITGVLPEALQLRKDDAALDARLDRAHRPDEVRAVITEFNARVVAARRQLLGGPPVVTPTRDPDAEVARWQERRRVREAEREAADAEARRAREEEAARRRARRRAGWPRWGRAEGGAR